MTESAVPSDFFLRLEARGFGQLIDSEPAHKKIQDTGPRGQFSYFTYEIEVQPKNTWSLDTTWAALPVDGLWAFTSASGVVPAGPCMFSLCEKGDSHQDWPAPELARHWCPILFE